MFSCDILWFSRDAEYISLSEGYAVWSQFLALGTYLQKNQSFSHIGLLHLLPQECLQHVKELINLENYVHL